MTHEFDVLVVGGRVAGALLATHLGEAGFRVLLLDRARFPSDTLSTRLLPGAHLSRPRRRGGLRRARRQRTAPAGSGRRCAGDGPGWALVGDAGMAMDPWSGQGIDQASTTPLARRLSEFLGERTNWEAAMTACHHERNEFSLKTYRRTCENGRDLRPMTRDALRRRGLA